MNFRNIVDLFTLAIALTFVGLGVYVIFSGAFTNIPLNYKLVFGSILIAYGGFRTVTIILKMKYKNNESEDDE